MTLTFYIISVEINNHFGDGDDSTFHSHMEHNELFISPNVRLAGFSGAACLRSEKLAKSWASACEVVFEKRGKPVQLNIHQQVSNGSQIETLKLAARIEGDSKLVSARLKQNCMAPNKKPK